MSTPSWLEETGPDMSAAMKMARNTMPRFAREVEMDHWRVVPAFDAVLIKAYIHPPDNEQQGEFLFISDVVINNKSILGVLASQPQHLSHVQAGEVINLPLGSLCDWMLVSDGKGIGGFTVDVLKKQIPDHERTEYEQHPPVSWYVHRGTRTAGDEIKALTPCLSCNDHDLTPIVAEDGQCGYCKNDLTRTHCTACSMKIIRGPGAPDQCYGCLNGL